jgi:hypothetical protein
MRCGGNNFLRLGGTEIQVASWVLRNFDANNDITIERMCIFDANAVVLFDSAASTLPQSQTGNIGPGNNVLLANQTTQFNSDEVIPFLPQPQRPIQLEVQWFVAQSGNYARRYHCAGSASARCDDRSTTGGARAARRGVPHHLDAVRRGNFRKAPTDASPPAFFCWRASRRPRWCASIACCCAQARPAADVAFRFSSVREALTSESRRQGSLSPLSPLRHLLSVLCSLRTARARWTSHATINDHKKNTARLIGMDIG